MCVCGASHSQSCSPRSKCFFFPSSQPSSLSVFLTICQFLCYMYPLLLISFPHLAFCSLFFSPPPVSLSPLSSVCVSQHDFSICFLPLKESLLLLGRSFSLSAPHLFLKKNSSRPCLRPLRFSHFYLFFFFSSRSLQLPLFVSLPLFPVTPPFLYCPG